MWLSWGVEGWLKGTKEWAGNPGLFLMGWQATFLVASRVLPAQALDRTLWGEVLGIPPRLYREACRLGFSSTERILLNS